MHVGKDGISHKGIHDLPSLLAPGDLLVLNDTKVRKARLRATKPGGGNVEILVERIGENGRNASAMLRSNKKVPPGAVLKAGETTIRVTAREGRLSVLEIDLGLDFASLLESEGEVPLPPYLRRRPVEDDIERYQTVYARVPGSCAAPTAGLHFTEELLRRLSEQGVRVVALTLHVGFGTFLPVERGAAELHAEWFSVPQETLDAVAEARSDGRRVVACGTTALRALEASDSGGGATEGETRLFIRPGFEFRAATTLLTNFHLPRSSLLALVCAFGGTGRILDAYRIAVADRYRFFSYGDAMLVERP